MYFSGLSLSFLSSSIETTLSDSVSCFCGVGFSVSIVGFVSCFCGVSFLIVGCGVGSGVNSVSGADCLSSSLLFSINVS